MQVGKCSTIVYCVGMSLCAWPYSCPWGERNQIFQEPELQKDMEYLMRVLETELGLNSCPALPGAKPCAPVQTTSVCIAGYVLPHRSVLIR